jgi:hypothetical protein
LCNACGGIGVKQDAETKTESLTFDFVLNGDIIYRYGNGYFSRYFRDFSEKEKIYSHAGIIEIRHDSIFVIHSEADEFTGIGGVKEDPLPVFMEDAFPWAVYRPDVPQSVRDKIVEKALEYVRKKTPFDLSFDAGSDESLYCTELIAVCMNKAAGKTLVRPGVRVKGKQFYSIDDTYLIKEMKLVYKSDQAETGK